MATYVYRCDECQFESHVIFKPGDSPRRLPCLHCDTGTARRVFTPPAVVFRGPGFYKTDSRSG